MAKAEEPVLIGSYGTGVATIDGGAGSAVVIRGCTGVTIRRLNVVGAGRNTGNQHGVGVLVDHSHFVLIDRVEASGFQRAGVEFRLCRDLRITQVYAHDNGYAGISCVGHSECVYLGRCRTINNPGDPTVLDNHSGNGIVLYAVVSTTVEYCEAAENGWDMPWHGNGPVGIWCACEADRVLIQ